MSYDEHLISMAGGDGEPDLDQIQARADAATEGPWKAEHYAVDEDEGRIRVTSPSDSDIYNTAEAVRPLDATFIAHARTDVPALIALVRDQQAKLDRGNAALFDVLHKWRNGDHVNYADIEGIRAAITATEVGE